MTLRETIHSLTKIDTKPMKTKMKSLLKELGVEKQRLSLFDNTDELQTLFLSNLDLNTSSKQIKMQLEQNKDKYLKLFCKVDGKQQLVKSFGRIENLELKTLIKIYELMKIIKIIQASNTLFYESAGFMSVRSVVFKDFELP